MDNWEYFNSELHYKYVNLLLKDLSLIEKAYLKFLRDGVDAQIDTTLSWYDEYYEDLTGLHDKEDFDDYYADSFLEMILITMMNNLLNHNRDYIHRFYMSGSNLGYNHMGKSSQFLPSDEESLNILTDYTNTVVESINGEFNYGVRNILGEHIENGTLDQFKKDLIKLPYTPIDTHFSVDNRCIFTTKTEYARGVNTGLLQSYSNYGVDQYDWVTSGLSNVCKTCKGYEAGNPYTLNEIMGMMPCHPNCVCSVKARLPKILYLQDKPQIVNMTPKK